VHHRPGAGEAAVDARPFAELALVEPAKRSIRVRIPQPLASGTTTKRVRPSMKARSSSATDVSGATCGTSGRITVVTGRSPIPCDSALSRTWRVTTPVSVSPAWTGIALMRSRTRRSFASATVASAAHVCRYGVASDAAVQPAPSASRIAWSSSSASSTALRPRTRAAAAVAWPPPPSGVSSLPASRLRWVERAMTTI